MSRARMVAAEPDCNPARACVTPVRWLRALAAALAIAAPVAVRATDYEKRADDLIVFLGVVPSELVRDTHAGPAAMHGRRYASSGRHHVLVSIVDERTGRRVEDAKVEARVGATGLGEIVRVLEPMKIGETTTYGNVFPMPAPGAYTVRVSILRTQHDRATEVTFDYSHPR